MTATEIIRMNLECGVGSGIYEIKLDGEDKGEEGMIDEGESLERNFTL